MPYFNFSPTFKAVKAKKIVKPKARFNIITKNEKAYVDINEDLDYIATFEDGRSYRIHKRSYKCKNKKIIYSQCLIGEYKNRLIIHRIPDACVEHRPYLPFAVGCVIIGNVVLDNNDNIKYFMINKCYVDNNDRIAYLITKGFKDIYNQELEQRIIMKYSQYE
ncbi:MAG: hypothetical protein KNU04_gp69 [crAssphage sp. isolate ctbg_1]|uniref:Uncharacterized protein n=1 Tax=crAssphage sp. isolate ctbg_1 TaxID=2989854 RepID=A0A345MT19_9CAUD|nr:MAG: hypothetical protein KNU04_gp69 [crAssphage sp. isolate ctbg_1]AXH74519.1 MAG: hypothetical protein [crAssphage sp. isolate ctbg_1]